MSLSDDLFALIGLDLECDDATTIKDAVARTRESCSRGSTTGPNKVGCEQLLERLSEIERVLLNPQARAALREEVRAARGAQSEALLKDASRVLTVLLAGGRNSITKLERDTFVARYAKPGGPTEAQIDALITVPVVDDANPTPDRAAPLPASEVTMLTSNLDALGCIDLYDFLGVVADADAATIESRRRELSAFWNKKAKSSAEKTAAVALLGKAAILLVDQAKRASYDETLAQAMLEPFRKDIELALADGRLSQAEFRLLIATAAETYGLDAARAEAVIITEAKKKPGTLVDVPSDYTPPAQWQCGVCRTYNPTTTGLCLHCKTPRKVQCPACDAEYESTAGICPGCRATINDAIWLWRLRDDVRRTTRAGDGAVPRKQDPEVAQRRGDRCGQRSTRCAQSGQRHGERSPPACGTSASRHARRSVCRPGGLCRAAHAHRRRTRTHDAIRCRRPREERRSGGDTLRAGG